MALPTDDLCPPPMKFPSPRGLSSAGACVRTVTVTLVAAVALASPLSQAAAPPAESSIATEFHCPATLAQVPVTDDVPAGWVVHGPPGELRLQRATFYDGDPVGLGTIAPDSTHRSGLTETSTWRFETGDSARVWIGCHYRDATAVVGRPLPGGLDECTTVTRLTPSGDPSEPLSVRCR